MAQAYGTGSQITVIPAAAFRGVSSSDQFQGLSGGGGTITPIAAGGIDVIAPILPPNGAVLDEIRVLVTDLDPATNIDASLVGMGQGVSSATTCGPFSYASWNNTSVGLTGTGILTIQGVQPVPIESVILCGLTGQPSYAGYALKVGLYSTNHTLAGAVLVWHRQMSPAPATATFNDVPTSDPYFRAIEALAASGVTSGCGGGNFCPNDVVTRSQLAKFLAVALGLHFPQ
ncbi:MAG TPA: S-layer homology domain-containing protein [Thermoanaerobaculia bacterium]|nr:S-layer homology domain-containing protein [Thermoanaerobaculia bacterium]